MRHSPRNRMAPTATHIAQPIERAIVNPPPESVIRCPHCGAARTNQWRHLGGVTSTGAHRKQCKACGKKVHIAQDYKSIRIIG